MRYKTTDAVEWRKTIGFVRVYCVMCTIFYR